MSKKPRDTTLRRTTEAIGALNQIRVETEHSKETLRNDQAERDLIEKKVSGLKEELRIKLEEKRIIEEFIQANPVDPIKATIIRLNQELEGLKNNIEKQIEDNRIREEAELKDIRELKSNTIDTLNELNLKLAKVKESVVGEALNFESLLEKIRLSKIELDKINKLREEQAIKIEVEDARIESRMHDLNDLEKKNRMYRDRLQRWAKKINVQLK